MAYLKHIISGTTTYEIAAGCYPTQASITTIPWNTEVRIGSIAADKTITFAAPATDISQEVRITLTYTSGTVTFTAPTGYSIAWPDDAPTFTAGNAYEISFATIDDSHIIGLYKEITLS